MGVVNKSSLGTTDMESLTTEYIQSNFDNNNLHIRITGGDEENLVTAGLLSDTITSGQNITIYEDDNQSVFQQWNDSLFMSYEQNLLDFGVAILVLLTVVGVVGNVISILALLNCKRFRNATTSFIVNLCVADLMFCSTAFPQTIIIFIERTWNYGDWLCKMFTFIKYSNTIVSYFTILAITVNRYILILHPKLYPRLFSKKRIGIVIGLIWIYAFVNLMLPLLEIWGKLGYDPKISECTIMDHNGSPKKVYYMSFIPYLLFIICYIRIYFAVRKTQKNTQKYTRECLPQMIAPSGYRYARREFQILKITLVIFISYVLWYFPISYVKIFRKEREFPCLNVFAYVFFFLSHVTTPFIFIIISKEYRKVYKDLFYK